MIELQLPLIKERSEIEKIKSVPAIFLKSPYDRIVAIVNKTRVRDQEEKNKIFTIY